MTTYCTNLALKASTEYTNYGFDSFCEFGGKYYGIKADGLYLLEGQSDNGTDIDALLDFGDMDFGTSQEKRFSTAYLQVASDAVMELRVSSFGNSYNYAARSYSERLQAQRVDVGKGLRDNYYGVAVANTEGCEFTLDSVELAAQALGRRI